MIKQYRIIRKDNRVKQSTNTKVISTYRVQLVQI